MNIKNLTEEQIDEFRKQAKEQIDRKLNFYFREKPIDNKYSALDEKGNNNYFNFCNREYWDGNITKEMLKTFLSNENVTKAIIIKKYIETLDYERYHWVIETTELIEFAYGYHLENWDVKQFHAQGYLGSVIDNDGDLIKALNSFLGDAEMFIDHANDIAATAF